MEKLIGREKELAKLDKYIASDRPEFIAVYGRRRVGKTFLIRRYFNERFDFFTTGIIEGSYKDETDAFYLSLRKYGYKGKKPSGWLNMFEALASLINKKAGKKRCVIFIDEISCFDTRNSGFVKALGHFWNDTASRQDNVFFVICGSATSWMIRNVINNKGGLHNRATHELSLRPFDLYQTEQYFKSKRSKWSRVSILQTYMALGGVPYYLSLLDMDDSTANNIDNLFFAYDAPLKDEYRRLFRSLYKSPEKYIDVIELLASHRGGLTRAEISKKLKIASSRHLTDILDDLEYCDFIRKFRNGMKNNSEIYQLIDFFTIFHNQFVKKPSSDTHFWRNTINTPAQNNWYGLSYERVCMFHIQHILKALRLDTIHTEFYALRCEDADGKKAQIDMVIDRSDGLIDICEVKYSLGKYAMTAQEYNKIQNRLDAFSQWDKSGKGLHLVLITVNGVAKSAYNDMFQRIIVADDLFCNIAE